MIERIERLNLEGIPTQCDIICKMWNKINEMIDYINNGDKKHPTILYAIENICTGEIIFNARGGAYQNKYAAMNKLEELGTKEYRIVEYKLKSTRE